MTYSATERARDFQPLPPIMTREQVAAREVSIGDYLVFSPSDYGDRREWVPVQSLEMDSRKARFKAYGRETIEVAIEQRMDVVRPRAICSVRKYVGEGRNRHSVDVCEWTAGHDGKHEWEYETEGEDDSEAAADE